MDPLDGRVILVTGSANRIGRGIALRLAQAGARVAIHYGGSADAARATAAECGNAPVFQANLEQVSDIERLFTKVEHTFEASTAWSITPRVSHVSTRSKSPRRIGIRSTMSTSKPLSSVASR